ncbi:MAG: (Fe-S)-binding protein [Janibacter sp.]
MRVALMATCIGDTMFPDVARATVRLLERLGVDVEVPDGGTCCGQPMINTGYFDEAEPLVRNYARTFADFDAVVLPSGSCVGSVRHQHELVARRSGDADLEKAVQHHAPRAYELSEFLVDVLEVTDVGASFPHTVAYHPTCHSLRMLGVGDRPRQLLESVEGLQLVDLAQAQECCGFGGTFALKNADVSTAMGEDKAQHAIDSGAEFLIAGDSSCLMQIGGLLSRREAPVRTMHLAEVLAAEEDA